MNPVCVWKNSLTVNDENCIKKGLHKQPFFCTGKWFKFQFVALLSKASL